MLGSEKVEHTHVTPWSSSSSTSSGIRSTSNVRPRLLMPELFDELVDQRHNPTPVHQ